MHAVVFEVALTVFTPHARPRKFVAVKTGASVASSQEPSKRGLADSLLFAHIRIAIYTHPPNTARSHTKRDTAQEQRYGTRTSAANNRRSGLRLFRLAVTHGRRSSEPARTGCGKLGS